VIPPGCLLNARNCHVDLTRKQHSRRTSRYQSDLTDEEWCVIQPHLPAANPTGRPRVWPMREIINGIFYVMRSGCPWRLLPSDLPPWSTVYRWFATFRDDSRFEKINHALVMLDRERIGRQASPTAAIIDSQSVKTTEAGGSTRLRCWKEDQWAQAPRARRHRWAWPHARTTSGESIQDRDGADRSCGPRAASSRSSSGCSPTADMRVRRSPRRPGSRSRSCVRTPPGRLRRSVTALVRRTILRMDRAQSEIGKGLRGHDRLCARFPLRRFRHAPRASDRACFMSFETDS
jgi:transposase